MAKETLSSAKLRKVLTALEGNWAAEMEGYHTYLTLADRVYDCGACALVIDRDVNAAVNLARYTPPPKAAQPRKAPPLPAAA